MRRWASIIGILLAISGLALGLLAVAALHAGYNAGSSSDRALIFGVLLGAIGLGTFAAARLL
jgi:hypothetical protein